MSRSWRTTSLVMLVAVAVRLGAFGVVPGLTYDGTYYLRQAERLVRLQYDFVGFPPGYPLAVACLHLVVRDYELAGRLVSLLAGLGAILLVHRWARRSLSEPLALVAALFLAVHPYLVQSSVETLSESLYLLATLAGIALFEARRDALAGACLGYAFLVRPEALLLVVGLVCVRGVRERRLPGALLAAGLAPVGIFALLASHALGHPVVSPKQGQLDLGPQVWTRLAIAVKMLHQSFPIVLVPVALAVGIEKRRHLLVPLLYLLTLPWFAIHIQPRLLLGALPFLTVLALEWISGLRAIWRRSVLAAAGGLFLIAAAPGYRNLARPFVLTPHGREIGAALRPYLRFEDKVAGRFPLVAYYAGAGFVRVPITAYPSLMDSIVAAGATHLLVLEGEMHGILPQLRPLFDDARFVTAEGRLEGVAWVEPAPEARAILYRLHPPAVPARAAPTLRQDAVDCAWLGSRLVAAGQDGALRVAGTESAPLAGRDGRDSEPHAGGDGARIVFCRERGSERCVAELEVASGRVRLLHSTAGDDPAWPVYVPGHILYVRRAEPRGMRALELGTDRVRAVRLQGLDPARAVPLHVAARGRDIAVVFLPIGAENPAHRIVATASWPASDAGGEIELAGRWATRLSLADDPTCWVPGSDRLLVSVSIALQGAKNDTRTASLCVLDSSGVFRRLTYDIVGARRPALRSGTLAFIGGAGDLHTAPLDAEALQVPSVHVFSDPAPPSNRPQP